MKPGCRNRYERGVWPGFRSRLQQPVPLGYGPCRIGAWQRGGTVSDRQADVFADGRGWRACLSRATRFRWRIGIEIACMETMKEILERAAASPAGKELAAAAASGEVAVLKGVSVLPMRCMPLRSWSGGVACTSSSAGTGMRQPT